MCTPQSALVVIRRRAELFAETHGIQLWPIYIEKLSCDIYLVAMPEIVFSEHLLVILDCTKNYNLLDIVVTCCSVLKSPLSVSEDTPVNEI